jgi:hypothetical protein
MSKRIDLRVSEEDFAWLQEQAQALGMPLPAMVRVRGALRNLPQPSVMFRTIPCGCRISTRQCSATFRKVPCRCRNGTTWRSPRRPTYTPSCYVHPKLHSVDNKGKIELAISDRLETALARALANTDKRRRTHGA